MSKTLEIEFEIENITGVKEAFRQFHMELQESLYRRFQRMANREEKILKSTTGFKDRTGKLRKSLAVVARWKPLGLDVAAYAEYAYWVAHGHGTWKGNWWLTYIKGLMERLPNDATQAMARAVKSFNDKYGGR